MIGTLILTAALAVAADPPTLAPKDLVPPADTAGKTQHWAEFKTKFDGNRVRITGLATLLADEKLCILTLPAPAPESVRIQFKPSNFAALSAKIADLKERKQRPYVTVEGTCMCEFRAGTLLKIRVEKATITNLEGKAK